MLGTGRFSVKLSIFLLIAISMGFRHLPNKIQLIVGIPLLTIFVLVAIMTKLDTYVKAVLLMCAVLGFLYFIAIAVKLVAIKEAAMFLGGVLLIIFIVTDRIKEHKQEPSERLFRKREIFALLFLIFMLIVLLL